MPPPNPTLLPAGNLLVTGGTFSQIQGDYHYHQYNTAQQETGLQRLSQEISHTAMHDSSARDPPPRCHPDTRKSIVKDLMRWIQDPNPDADIFWLHGTAGVGKSAILQTIADLLREMGQHFAGSFFFGRDKPGRDKSHYLFPTIAYQLATLVPDLRGPINQAMRFDPTTVKKMLDVQLQSLIIIPCQQLTSDILTSHTPTVIIDGLDECSAHEQQLAILSVIAKALAISRVPLRFLIASRPEPHISQFFKEASFKYASLWIPIDTQEVRDDIRKVFVDGFEKIQRQHAFSLSSLRESWPGDDVISLLVSRASGQFIYVDTVLRFVGAEHHKPSKQLSIILNMPHPSSSTALAAVDELYMQILHLCPYPEILAHILGFIVDRLQGYSRAIEAIFGLEEGDVSTVLQPLHSVIQCQATEVITSAVPGENEVLAAHYLPDIMLSFYHASFSDFLQDRCRSAIFHVDREAVRDQITTRAANLVISSLQQPPAQVLHKRTWAYMRNFLPAFDGLTPDPPRFISWKGALLRGLRDINYLANLDDASQTLIKHSDVCPPSSTHLMALQFVCHQLRMKSPPTAITEDEYQLSLSIFANCQKCLDRWYFHYLSTSRLLQDSPFALFLLCRPGILLRALHEQVGLGVVHEFLTRCPYLFQMDTCLAPYPRTFWFAPTVCDFLLDESRSCGFHALLRNQWLGALEPLFSVRSRGRCLFLIQDIEDPSVRLCLHLAYQFFRTPLISDIRHCDIREPHDASPFGRLIQHLLQIDFKFPDADRNSCAIHPHIVSLIENVLMWAQRQKENKKCKEDAKNLCRLVMDKIFSEDFLLFALPTRKNYFRGNPPFGISSDCSYFISTEWFMVTYASICEYIMGERRSSKRMVTASTYHTRIAEFLLHTFVTVLYSPSSGPCTIFAVTLPGDHQSGDIPDLWKEFIELDAKWSWHLGSSEKSEKITIALEAIHHQNTVAEEKAEEPPYDLMMGAIIYLQKVPEPEYDYLRSWYKELEESCRPLHTGD